VSRLSTLIKVGVLATSIAGGWRYYEAYLDRTAILDKGRHAMAHNEFGPAIEYLQVAFQQDPDDLTICLDLAECCARTGQDRDALAWYRKAEPLLSAESSSVSLMRHKERFVYLSQKNDWSTTPSPWKGSRRH
jgi:tetratricopeptide (TPR) repeat protein